MGVPLTWLVRHQDLRLRVLAGHGDLDREVVWAHSIELTDPAPWLSGGELVLTTGLRLTETPAGCAEYVGRLVKAGVAAVGFGVGLSHGQVPPALVEAAGEAGLPLLEVPLPTPFVAVTKAVMERLAEQQYEGVVEASRAQPRMTRAALHGGAQSVVRVLAAATGTSVVLLDHEDKVRASHPPGAGVPEAAVVAGLRASERAAAAVSTGQDGAVAVQRVRVGPRAHGRLVLTADRPLTPVDHLLLGHAASLVALESEKPLRLRDEQNRVNALFLRMLLDGGVAAPAARDHLAEAGFPVREGIRVLALRGGGPRRILEAVGSELAAAGLPLFGRGHTGCAVVLLPAADAVTARSVTEGARARLKSRVWAGLSAAHDPADAPAALTEALNASSAAETRGESGVVPFESLAGRLLSAVPETRRILATLAQTQLAPIAAYDTGHGTDLLVSLRTFLEHNGQWAPASAALGVHRHTLSARMDRVRGLLGADLDSAHVRAELLLALSVWQEPDDTGRTG
ncbi:MULTISPECIES: PucR family transcriptional regulator [unclassified Streptomyces]|uniref:PucR family transcriptional regulator n=1 Tax=unclassified Streptomyces TaxID=2593676 RepID=UPI003426C334